MDLHYIHLDSTPSTNLHAKAHASAFATNAITCVSAETQTAGRGRFHRRWSSPGGGNIYATFAFRLPLASRDLGSLAQLMALSLSEVLHDEGLHTLIKWPNDVQLAGKKLAGVLCEIEFHADAALLFIGIGVNVNSSAKDLAGIDQAATSLAIETKRAWDHHALLKQLAEKFSRNLERFRQEGFGPFCERLNLQLAYRGEVIRCSDGAQEFEGVCHSVQPDGQLVIALANGQTKIVASGDLRHDA